LPELLETVALSGGSARRRHMNPEVQANHLNETKALGSVACVFLYSGKRNWRLSLKMLPDKALTEERSKPRHCYRIY